MVRGHLTYEFPVLRKLYVNVFCRGRGAHVAWFAREIDFDEFV